MRVTAALVAAAVALAPLEGLAKSPGSGAETEAIELARRAEEHFAKLEPEAARVELEAGIARLPAFGAGQPRSRARLWVLLGRARAELGDARGASDAFYEALILDRRVRLPRGTSPKIMRALGEVRAGLPKEPRSAEGATGRIPSARRRGEARRAEASRRDQGLDVEPSRATILAAAPARDLEKKPTLDESLVLRDPPDWEPVYVMPPPAPRNEGPPEWEPVYVPPPPPRTAIKTRAPGAPAQVSAAAASEAAASKVAPPEDDTDAEVEVEDPNDARKIIDDARVALRSEPTADTVDARAILDDARAALHATLKKTVDARAVRDDAQMTSRAASKRAADARAVSDTKAAGGGDRPTPALPSLHDAWSSVEPEANAAPPERTEAPEPGSSMADPPVVPPLPPPSPVAKTTAPSPVKQDSGLLYLGLAGGVVLFLGTAAAIVVASARGPKCASRKGYGCTEVQISPLVSF